MMKGFSNFARSGLGRSLTRCTVSHLVTVAHSRPLPVRPVVMSLSSNVLSRHFSVDLSEKEFHVICDETLEHIQDELAHLEGDLNDADISLSQGVLNVNLGPSLGIWVINKQTPNRQIWWSSPLSGPRRYEYRPSATGDKAAIANWKHSKDGTSLLEALKEEMLKATGASLFGSH